MLRELTGTTTLPITREATRGRLASEVATTEVVIANMAKQTEWKLRSKLGLYPEDNPVTDYGRSILSELKQRDPNMNGLRVSVFRGEPNAFILPNGSIYMSDQLINLVGSKEELLFVLMHENIHQTEEHIKRTFEYAERSEGSIKDYLSQTGMSRMHEWGGDLKAFTRLDEMGINPGAGIHFLDKIRQTEQETGVKSNTTHGKTVDRSLNMHILTHLKDMKSLMKPLTPVDNLVKEEIQAEQQVEAFVSPYEKMKQHIHGYDYFGAMKAIETMDLNTLLITLEDFPRYFSYNGLGKELDKFMAKKLWEHFSATQVNGEYLTKQETTMLFAAVLYLNIKNRHLVDEDNLFDKSRRVTDPDSGNQVPWDKENFALRNFITSREDLEKVLTLLDTQIFQDMDLQFEAAPEHFASLIIKTSLENYVFEDENEMFDKEAFLAFTARFVDKLEALYNTYGTRRFNRKEVIGKIASLPKDYLFQQDYDEVSDALSQSADKNPLENLDTGEEIRSLVASVIKYSDAIKRTNPFSQNFVESTSRYEEEIEAIMQNISFQDTKEALLFIHAFNSALKNMELQQGVLYDDYGHVALLSSVIQKVDHLQDLGFYDQKTAYAKAAILLGLHFSISPAQGEDTIFYDMRRYFAEEDFKLEDLYDLYGLLSDPEYFTKEIGTHTDVVQFIEDPDYSNIIRAGIYSKLNTAALSGDIQVFQGILEEFMDDFQLSFFGVERGSDEAIDTVLNKKREMLQNAFKKLPLNLQNDDSIKTLYFLSSFLEDLGLSVKLQRVALGRLTDTMDFTEGLGFIQKELEANRALSFEAISNFIENKASSHEEIEMARNYLLNLIDQDTSFEAVGKLIVGEEFMHYFFDNDKLKMLTAFIGNGNDDELLKRALYKKWVKAFDANEIETRNSLDIEDIQQKLYRLDGQSKYVLIRELLTGEHGILMSKDSYERTEFINFFLHNYIVAENEIDRKLLSVIHDVMREVAQTASYDQLYLILSPLLQNRILKIPSQIKEWEEIILTETPPQRFKKFDSGDYEDEVNEASSQYTENTSLVEKEDIEEIQNAVIGRRKDQDLLLSGDDKLYYEGRIQEMLRGFENSNGFARLSVNEFIVEVAQKMGAPGVRFLQLIGQYIEIPSHLEQLFSSIYDQVEGQSKVSAHETLLREWPESKSELAGLNKRLGGGSQVSVFSSETRDGKAVAVKILNPNTEYHTDKMYSLLSNVFSTLSQGNPTFEPSLTLIDDIQEWIKNDINFKDFLTLDRQFRETHDGFSTGGRYQIAVPTSYPPENPYFSVEDFIEGTNLTNLEDLRNQGHSLQEISSLITKNFFSQIAFGMVHSDLHPGNIRVTPDNKISYLDRNYYLQLTNEDQSLLWNLTQSSSDPASALATCISYLRENGAEISGEVEERLRTDIRDQISDDPTDNLFQMALSLRKEGLRLPIRITLLIKDFYYLDKLAKRVGYNGIIESFVA